MAENTVGKGEIACDKQFLLFPKCFIRLALQTHENQVKVGKGLNLDWLINFMSFNRVNRKILATLGQSKHLSMISWS